MAKQEKRAPKGGVVATTWRGATVFSCSACPFTHEREERVKQHVARGNHLPTERPTGGSSEPQENAEAQGGGDAPEKGSEDA